MSMVERFRQWYAYERDCNTRTMEMLRSVPENRRGEAKFQRAVGRMAHMVAARRRWMYRMGLLSELPPLFPDTTLAELPEQIADIEQLWTNYLDRLEEAELARSFESVLANGKRYRLNVEQVLTQLFGHAFYHRGQVAQSVAELGGTTVDTDFIFWCSQPIDASE